MQLLRAMDVGLVEVLFW